MQVHVHRVFTRGANGAFRQAHLGGFTVLSGLGKHKVFGAVVLVQGVASIALGWFLAGPLELGLIDEISTRSREI